MTNGWEAKKLGDVCSFLNRGVSPKYVENGGIIVLNQRCVRDHRVSFDVSRRHDIKAKGVSTERLVQAGDVLVNSTGTGTLGRVAQLREDPPEPTTVDSHVTIVRPSPGRFFQEFFGYMLRDIEDELKESGDGCGGQTELNRSVLADKFVVRFPQSLAEQQRIVRLLDEAFAGLATAKANAERNLQNTGSLFENQLTWALNSDGRNWPLCALDSLLINNRKISYGIVKPGKHDPDGVRLIKSQQVRDNSMDLSEDFRITKKLDEEYARTRLQGGEILLNLVGASIGRSAIAPAELRAANVSRAIAVIPVRHELAPWVQYNLRCSVGQTMIETKTGGAAQPVLNLSEVKSMEIPIPALSVQRSIVEKLDALAEETQRLAHLYERKLAALDALKRSLLHQAFSGEL